MKIVHIMAGLGEANGIYQIARRFASEQMQSGIVTEFIAPRWKWNPLFFSFGFCLRAVRAAYSADEVWVHGSWTFPVWFGAFLAKHLHKRLVVVPEGSFDPRRLHNHAAWKKRLVAPFDRRILQNADMVLALCDAEVRWICDFEPSAKVRCGRVPTFFEGIKMHSVAERAQNRAVRILFLGRDGDPLKGVRYLRTAVDELNAASPGSQKFELRVERAVFGAEKEKAWAWCDVFCLPTLSENFGLVVAEALEHGLPVITTDGAPVWRDAPVTYLAGYLAASDARRVAMLKNALSRY